ncbi:MAG: transporter [FCB group bacterium]|nr:transporter [FCB group bacterium]
MINRFIAIALLLICTAEYAMGQNCCAPAVPQQGIAGETTALPHVLEIGLHYEYLCAREKYCGSDKIDDPVNTEADWKRTTLTASYGFMPGFSGSLILPYLQKAKSKDNLGSPTPFEWTSSGLGDMVCIVRYSPLKRSFVNFREISIGLGVKIPTGSTDEGMLLPQELQPGTGSWDYHWSLSYYQGFETVDFFVSGTYILTSAYDDYKFGNQFSYLASASIHLKEKLDLSLGLSGMIRRRDTENGVDVAMTGRHQLWLTPGIQYQAIPGKLRLQTYFEMPIYQHFNEEQLGSAYNLRLTAVYSLPLKKSSADDE